MDQNSEEPKHKESLGRKIKIICFPYISTFRFGITMHYTHFAGLKLERENEKKSAAIDVK